MASILRERGSPGGTMWATLTLFLLPLPALAADPLYADAQRILNTHCHRCHGQDGSVEGGFNYVLDFAKLSARKKVIPGNAAGSPIVRRISNGSMPPAGETPRVSDADLDTLKRWIDAGAQTDDTPVRAAISSNDVAERILEDLEKFDRRARRFQRYFTLHHLHNAGLSDSELQTYRNALAKLVNSLSWHPEIRNPEPIDLAKAILRIDLRWYQWDATLWNRVLNDYPYGVLDDTATARVLMVNTATKVPTIRADWFVATASRAPLYYDLLQLPGNLPELERQLRVDAAVNIQQERVMRVGFNGSGVSRFNRVLERHDSAHGAYWRSYDFDEPPQNLNERTSSQPPDRRNIFAFPLGPGVVTSSFQHAGGEMIFTLPNGLHGYYLTNAVNERLNKAPTAIVSDPRRPDRAVEAGVSCMSCHLTGILPKADQVREHLEKNPKAFNRADAELIAALYPAKDKTLAAMESDGKKYSAAVAKTGAKVGRTEAVGIITQRFEADVDLTLAAAEVGVLPEEFRKRIDTSEVLKKNVGALRVPGGTVSRAVWQQGFGDLARELHLGVLFQSNTNGGNRADNTGELDPLEAQGNVANAVGFTADGKRAIIASADRSVRVWDVEAKRDGKRLVGHTASVWAVALNGDGTKAISGSADGTARVWDLSRGTEVQKLDGHASLVSAVALTADGKRAITGGFDGAVVWWDGTSGTELRRWEGEAKTVHAVALHPNQNLALIAADRSLVLWDVSTGEIVKRWVAHGGAVTAIAFAEGGKRIVSAGDDRTVKVWDTAGKKFAEWTGPSRGIRGLTTNPSGRWVAMASGDGTVTLWDTTAQQESATFRRHGQPVVGVTFLPSGHRTLSLDRDLGTQIWDVSKFLNAADITPTRDREVPDTIPKSKRE
jgi:WD40 repeat protein/mono/diheme cytochrome c family protein